MSSYLPSDIIDVLAVMQNDIQVLKNAQIGSILLDGTITAIGSNGVKTVMGDLSDIGENRTGIAQFVGDTTPPPVPTTPIVTASPGVIGITWDGENYNNEPMAPDFDHFNVYGSTGGSTFLVGSIKNESEVAVYAGAEGGTVWRFYLTSVDTNRNESGPSIVSEEVTAINAGADPAVYDAIEALRTALAKAEADALAANQAATAAQAKADAAMTTALAGGGKISIGPTEPTTKTDKMVWVNTSVTPYVASTWDASTSSWPASTGSALEVLALAAANAQKAADQASADAETAMEMANQAQSSANGKNNVYYVPALPGGTGFVVGDTAFIRSAVGQPITGQHTWDGSKWVSVTLNHQVISSVDLGKATVGELDGQYIKAQSITAKSLVLQNNDNLLPDPRFKYGSTIWGWDLSAAPTQDLTWDFDSTNGWIHTTTRLNTSVPIANSPQPLAQIEVEANTWYSASWDIAFYGPDGVVGPVNIFLEWIDSDGDVVYRDVAPSVDVLSVNSTIPVFSKVLLNAKKSPIPATHVRLGLMGIIPANALMYFRSPVISRAMDAHLIVDGSITASKIEANSIDASKIIAKSITSDKLVISSSDNLIEEPLFDAGGLGWILSPSSVYSASSGELNTNGITVEGGPTLVNNYENIGFSSRTASGSKSFKVFMRVKANTNIPVGKVRAVATYSRADGGEVGRSYSVYLNTEALTAGNWYNLEGSFSTTDAEVSRVRFGFGFNSASEGLSATFSEVSVYKKAGVTLIEDGAITTDKIAANSINAEKMRIGNNSNLILDEEFVSLNYWTPPSGGSGSGWSSDVLYGGASNSVKLTQHGSAVPVQALYASLPVPSQYIPVVPGEQYKVTSMVWATGPVGNLSSVSQRVYFYDKNKTSNTNDNAKTINAADWDTTGSWVEVGGIVTVPADRYYMAPRLSIYYPNNTASSNNTAWYIGKVSVARANDDSLFVDGSIRAQKLTLGSTDNVITDPWFSQPTTEWAGSGSASFPLTGGYDGKGCMVMTNTNVQQGRYSAQIISEGVSAYKFSAWVKSSVSMPLNSVSLYVRVKFANGTVSTQNVASVPVTSANTWVKLEGNRSWNSSSVIGVDFGLFTQNNITSGTTTFSMPNATRMMGGELIVDGAITGKTLTGNTIIGGSISGTVVKGGTGTEGYAISLNNDSNGAYIGLSTPNSTTSATIRAVNGDDAYPELVLRSPAEAGETARSYIKLRSMPTGASTRLHLGGDVMCDTNWLFSNNISPIGSVMNLGAGASIFAMGIYNREYTFTTNMHVTNNGYIGKTTSTRASKVSIEDLREDQIQSLLTVHPRTWFDRGDSERLADYESLVHLGVLTLEQQEDAKQLYDSIQGVGRVPGLIAEEVENAGATDFAIYETKEDGTKKLTGVAYDRIGPALLPVVKRLQEANLANEKRIQDLESKMDLLIARIEALESN